MSAVPCFFLCFLLFSVVSSGTLKKQPVKQIKTVQTVLDPGHQLTPEVGPHAPAHSHYLAVLEEHRKQLQQQGDQRPGYLAQQLGPGGTSTVAVSQTNWAQNAAQPHAPSPTLRPTAAPAPTPREPALLELLETETSAGRLLGLKAAEPPRNAAPDANDDPTGGAAALAAAVSMTNGIDVEVEDAALPGGGGGGEVNRFHVDPVAAQTLLNKLKLARPKDPLLHVQSRTKKPFATCAVVGNSPTILNSTCGSRVDLADAVFRLDLAALDGFAEDVGRRTTLMWLSFRSLMAESGSGPLAHTALDYEAMYGSGGKGTNKNKNNNSNKNQHKSVAGQYDSESATSDVGGEWDSAFAGRAKPKRPRPNNPFLDAVLKGDAGQGDKLPKLTADDLRGKIPDDRPLQKSHKKVTAGQLRRRKRGNNGDGDLGPDQPVQYIVGTPLTHLASMAKHNTSFRHNSLLQTKRLRVISQEWVHLLQTMVLRMEQQERRVCREVTGRGAAGPSLSLPEPLLAVFSAMAWCDHVDVYGMEPGYCSHWTEYWQKQQQLSSGRPPHHYSPQERLFESLRDHAPLYEPVSQLSLGSVQFVWGPCIEGGSSAEHWSAQQLQCNPDERFPSGSPMQSLREHPTAALRGGGDAASWRKRLRSGEGTAVFNQLDTEGAGVLRSFNQVDDPLLRTAPWQNEWLNSDTNFKVRIYLFREYDVDGDGEILLREFNAVWIARVRLARNLRSLFSLFDIDGNDSLSLEEFALFQSCHADDVRVSFEVLLGLVDHSGDGELDLAEFACAELLLHCLHADAIRNRLERAAHWTKSAGPDGGAETSQFRVAELQEQGALSTSDPSADLDDGGALQRVHDRDLMLNHEKVDQVVSHLQSTYTAKLLAQRERDRAEVEALKAQLAAAEQAKKKAKQKLLKQAKDQPTPAAPVRPKTPSPTDKPKSLLDWIKSNDQKAAGSSRGPIGAIVEQKEPQKQLEGGGGGKNQRPDATSDQAPSSNAGEDEFPHAASDADGPFRYPTLKQKQTPSPTKSPRNSPPNPADHVGKGLGWKSSGSGSAESTAFSTHDTDPDQSAGLPVPAKRTFSPTRALTRSPTQQPTAAPTNPAPTPILTGLPRLGSPPSGPSPAQSRDRPADPESQSSRSTGHQSASSSNQSPSDQDEPRHRHSSSSKAPTISPTAAAPLGVPAKMSARTRPPTVPPSPTIAPTPRPTSPPTPQPSLAAVPVTPVVDDKTEFVCSELEKQACAVRCPNGVANCTCPDPSKPPDVVCRKGSLTIPVIDGRCSPANIVSCGEACSGHELQQCVCGSTVKSTCVKAAPVSPPSITTSKLVVEGLPSWYSKASPDCRGKDCP